MKYFPFIKKVNIKALVLGALVVFLSLIFLLTLKGNLGNPEPRHIEDDLRKRGEPFELSPERGRYALTQSLAEDGSVFLRKDIANYVTPDLGYIDGKFISLFSPGISLLATPLYLLGARFQAAQVTTFALPALFAIFNFLLIIKIAGYFNISLKSSVIAGLAFLFTTPAFAYSVSFYQHQTTTFLLLATAALLFSKRNLLKLTIATFLVGFSFWIDSQNPIFFIPLIVYAIYTSLKITTEEGISRVTFRLNHLFAVSGIILAIGGYSLYSFLVFNKPFQLSGTVGSVGSFNDKNEPVITETSKTKDPTRFFNTRAMVHGTATLTFNEDRGVIYYAPIMLLAFLGMKPMFENKRKKAAALLGTALFIFVLYTMWGDPYGGWAFGPRYMIPVFAFLSIFLAGALEAFGSNLKFKILLSILFIYGAAVNLLGALTTNQVPPKTEAIPLSLDWNYLLNWKLFVAGVTSSFFYKTFANSFVNLYTYAGIILGLILSLALGTIWFPKRKEN